ncbi:cytochrome P450 3A9-like isoform X2 [Tachypleus tridentatus]|uniref:cytochrome P450 3A9-like isoform X2 n=1 Tax=Tachypleus tridentatus TaxID=6853 RepID=UPI003FCFC12F
MEILGFLFVPNWLVYIIAALLAVHWYFTRNVGLWKRMGIKEIENRYPYESVLYNISKPVHEVEEERYNKYGNIYGKFEGTNPVLVMGDPDLIKLITIKDFHAFIDRRVFSADDPILSKFLSIQSGEEWKQTRSVISPTFSPSNIKKMTGLVEDTVKSLIRNLEEAADENKVIDCKRLFGAFTMDTIAACAFGTRIDSYKNLDNPFVTYARTQFNRDITFTEVLGLINPKLARFFGIRFISKEIIDFFKNVSNQIIEYRQEQKEKRNDFLQLMLNALQSTQEVQDDPDEVTNLMDSEYGYKDENNEFMLKPSKRKIMTRDDILANSILFFLAGYDTTASALTYCAYCLALNQECQEKLIQEIDHVWEEHGGINYEQIGKMVYLDCVLSETLRLHTIASFFERRANIDYELGDTGITIPKGTIVQIPVHAIHHDPKYYPEPNTFDPERFLPENKKCRHPYTYLPFGAGHRNCVGMRFALLEAKLCLAHVLRNFRFHRCSETKVPLEYYNGLGLIQAKQVSLVVEKRAEVWSQ